MVSRFWVQTQWVGLVVSSVGEYELGVSSLCLVEEKTTVNIYIHINWLSLYIDNQCGPSY